MVAAKSAWNYACPLQKQQQQQKQTNKQTNNVIVNFMKNYNLPSSLLLSNSGPVLTWHYIFPYLASSLSMLDYYGRDSPTHLTLTTIFYLFST